MIVPTFDACGRWRSLRAIRIVDGDAPKRLPPGGFRASGLLLANVRAISMLRGAVQPERLIIVEGEPDWLTWCERARDGDAVLGIVSGSWSDQVGARIPADAIVVIRTHEDDAGEGYARDIARTLPHCRLWRAASHG